MKRAALVAALSFAALALGAPAAVQAGVGEAIESYHSEITVHPDGTLHVTEEIRVRAEGREIRRGIYREIPTLYREYFGLLRRTVGFEFIQVTRDGVPEPHHMQKATNGIQVYAGEEDVFLDPGVYTYRLSYQYWQGVWDVGFRIICEDEEPTAERVAVAE